MDLARSPESSHLSFYCITIYISEKATGLGDLLKKILP